MKRWRYLLVFSLMLWCSACGNLPVDRTEIKQEEAPPFNSLIRQGSRFDVYGGEVLRLYLYLQQPDQKEMYYQMNGDGTACYEKADKNPGPTGMLSYRHLWSVMNAVAQYANEQGFGLNETSVMGKRLPMYATLSFGTEDIAVVQNGTPPPYFICSLRDKNVVSATGMYQGTAIGVLKAVNTATPDPVYIIIEP